MIKQGIISSCGHNITMRNLLKQMIRTGTDIKLQPSGYSIIVAIAIELEQLATTAYQLAAFCTICSNSKKQPNDN